jgi:hypothetical protein
MNFNGEKEYSARLVFIIVLSQLLIVLGFVSNFSVHKEKQNQVLVKECSNLFNNTVANNPSGLLASIIGASTTEEGVVFIKYKYNHGYGEQRLTFCGISGDTVIMNPKIETLYMLLGKK